MRIKKDVKTKELLHLFLHYINLYAETVSYFSPFFTNTLGKYGMFVALGNFCVSRQKAQCGL